MSIYQQFIPFPKSIYSGLSFDIRNIIVRIQIPRTHKNFYIIFVNTRLNILSFMESPRENGGIFTSQNENSVRTVIALPVYAFNLR